MKKLLYIVVSLCLLAGGCQKYDDTELRNDINDLKERVETLETLCRNMNNDITALKALVKAVETRDYITDVAPITGTDGVVTGYTISFANSDPITINHGMDGDNGQDGEDGQDGSDGRDGTTPVIGVSQGEDGVYYWTLNGDWLQDDDGNRIKASGDENSDGADGTDGVDGKDGKDGVTPQLKIEDGMWYVSYDNGGSWHEVGSATGEQGPQGEQGETGPQGPQGAPGVGGDSMFTDVDYSSSADYVIFTLSNGTQIKIPTWSAFEALQVECEKMNRNIEALQEIVAALQTNDYIVSVTPIYEGITEIGYKILFGSGTIITIYHGNDGKDGADGAPGQDGADGEDGTDGANGQDGKDGITPVIGVRQDTDGIYYWTLNGEWLLDDNGQKVKAVGEDGKDGEDSSAGSDGTDGKDGKDGVTPQLKIEGGMWYVSYDNGGSWHEVGQATGDQGETGPQGPQGPQGAPGVGGDSMFTDVDYSSSTDYVTFTLSNGTQIKVPTWSAFEALQLECDKMNRNIAALQEIVSALQNNDYIVSVTPIYEGINEIGYKILFSSGNSITIYHGKDGQDGADGAPGQDGEDGTDGADGKDGVTPVIGVRQDSDGIYYWTINGEWLLDDNGQKVKAVGQDGTDGKDGKDGVTPQLKIENGKWYVSYDNGKSWHEVGQATGPQGESFFKSVTQDESFVYLTLSDGTMITLPKESPCPVEVTLGQVTPTTATFNGTVDKKSLDLRVTIHYSTSADMTVYDSESVSQTKFSGNAFNIVLTDLIWETQYYYFVSVFYNGKTYYSMVNAFMTAADPYASAVSLSSSGTANSYIVSDKGSYSFPSVKGNSSESVGAVAYAEVLWETFGTSEAPSKGDLIQSSDYRDGKIYFKTVDTYREGNAVIAAKDASGTILWSWHIWLTDQPAEQVYYNNAGTMMDRNLGAISATPGDVGALGLLYQWGRKDPFLSSSSVSSSIEAASTITWPSSVSSNSSTGTIEYALSHPTTFIFENSENRDWYYTGSSSTDNTRWTISSSSKSIYDPCPSGWRVPDGGDYGVWSNALGSSSSFEDASLYNNTNEGMNFSGMFGSASTTWYPASGCRSFYSGNLTNVSGSGFCWSASPSSKWACCLEFDNYDNVYPSDKSTRTLGYSVRCIKEGTGGSSDSGNSDISTSSAVNLSSNGSANSYIVSKSGTYSISAVKGNSNTSVGSVSSVEVLWETFGTDREPLVGALISGVIYENGKVYFKTAYTYREGNAVIAAKDASGTILWSWHIWLTDQPAEQVYYNNAGTMMDRNLGATSATPGDVGALGLLYQWGRKDPFLGSSSISSSVVAKSTITWPSAVSSNSSNGTIEYATAHPTKFITYNNSNYDWYYTGSESIDNTRWTTSDGAKSIYDPCPKGWRVPDGGIAGVWSTVLDTPNSITAAFDSYNKGMNFSGKFGSDSVIWYPCTGLYSSRDGGFDYVGEACYNWSSSASTSKYYLGAQYFNFWYNGNVFPSGGVADFASGMPVRCIQELRYF